MRADTDSRTQVEEPLSRDAAAGHLLDECRMVLPGLQALFGFQLIAVFTAGFSATLSAGEQRIHLLAIGLVVIAIALVMGPAALHRQAEPRLVTERFITISSHLLMWGMLPLALGICLDVYLVGRVVLGSRAVAGTVAAVLLSVIALVWYALPRSRTLQRLTGREPASQPLGARAEPRRSP
jgi:Family of unknown function (DUF6328)